MVREAVEGLGGQASYSDIHSYIKRKYGDVNSNTITTQIIVCSVNHASRVHYPENSKPRVANARYDFLFNTGRGQVEQYDSQKHGIWEIREDETGKLQVSRYDSLDVITEAAEERQVSVEVEGQQRDSDLTFPLESHLRDFLARNITSLQIDGRKLQLYVDDSGRAGVEYPTPMGPIDILAIDEADNYVVFELKLNRGSDSAVGQILRYMGWVQHKLAKSKVKGVIVARKMSEKMKYAVSLTPDITLFEYELQFSVHPVTIDARER
jgi:hypothetical protein